MDRTVYYSPVRRTRAPEKPWRCWEALQASLRARSALLIARCDQEGCRPLDRRLLWLSLSAPPLPRWTGAGLILALRSARVPFPHGNPALSALTAPAPGVLAQPALVFFPAAPALVVQPAPAPGEHVPLVVVARVPSVSALAAHCVRSHFACRDHVRAAYPLPSGYGRRERREDARKPGRPP